MYHQIWKYEIDFHFMRFQPPEIEMPLNAEILSVANQKDRLCIWAQVDPNETEKEMRKFLVVGTGHDMKVDDRCLWFIGTVQFAEGNLVLHVFEMEEFSGLEDDE